MFLTKNQLKNLGRKLELILKTKYNIEIDAIAGNQENQSIIFFIQNPKPTEKIPKNFREKEIKIISYE